jgi:hypothetical protein
VRFHGHVLIRQTPVTVFDSVAEEHKPTTPPSTTPSC